MLRAVTAAFCRMAPVGSVTRPVNSCAAKKLADNRNPSTNKKRAFFMFSSLTGCVKVGLRDHFALCWCNHGVGHGHGSVAIWLTLMLLLSQNRRRSSRRNSCLGNERIRLLR